MVTAQVALDKAGTNRAAAALTAPISGTAASLSLTRDATASTSSGVTIVGPGAIRVTVDVPLASIRSVRVGTTVSVTPDGSTRGVHGSVETIGLLPASSTASSTVSYPVVVLVPASTAALSSGSRAQVSLVLATVRNSVVVPNSALVPAGIGTAVATIMTYRTTTRAVVTTGSVGTFTTQVIQGLRAGQRVVLADRSQALPTNSANTFGRLGTGGLSGRGGLGTGGFSGGSGFGSRPGG